MNIPFNHYGYLGFVRTFKKRTIYKHPHVHDKGIPYIKKKCIYGNSFYKIYITLSGVVFVILFVILLYVQLVLI